MAAGLGTRLRPFTQYRNKTLFPLMGVPIAQYALDAFSELKVKDTIVNVHHLPDFTRKALGELDWGGMHYGISDESKRLLGSAGGLRFADHLFYEDSFLLWRNI